MGCGKDSHPNLLIITVDTLRRDVLGCYGSEFGITPNIDRLAETGVVLDSCYAVCPRTTQSLASLLTGLYPANHGAFGLFHELPQAVTTLAERLSAEGYRTAAVVTNYFIRKGQGFEQGFFIYDDSAFRAGSEVAETVVDRVGLMTTMPPEGPFFIWVHLLDPHWPYDPPRQIVKRLHPEYDRPFTLYQDIDSSRVTRGGVIFENSLDDRDRRHMQRRYLGEVYYTDAHIGRLMGLLEMNGYLDNTVVVLYSDHGESMGEHNYFYAHGETLYQPTVIIPTIIAYPGTLEPGRFTGLASSPDLFPTVLEIMGFEVPEKIDGLSLAGVLADGRESPRSTCYFESDYQLIHEENPAFHVDGPAGKWRAVLEGHHKLIRIPNPAGDEYELYDLRADPWESRNLIDSGSRIPDRMREDLREWEALLAKEAQQPETIDEESSQTLRSLGYLN